VEAEALTQRLNLSAACSLVGPFFFSFFFLPIEISREIMVDRQAQVPMRG
jgi:hypothetical protein